MAALHKIFFFKNIKTSASQYLINKNNTAAYLFTNNKNSKISLQLFVYVSDLRNILMVLRQSHVLQLILHVTNVVSDLWDALAIPLHFFIMYLLTQTQRFKHLHFI